MSILRTIKCDLCDEVCTEEDYGVGFPGWCIISGISKNDPDPSRSVIQEDMQSTFCPSHRELIARYIRKLDREE